MGKAREVIRVMDELAGDPIGSAGDLKSGQNVIFRKDHPNAGMLGIIIGPTKGQDGHVDLKVGKATRVGIPIADLLTVTSPGSGIGDAGKATGGTPVANNGAQAGTPATTGQYTGDAGKFGRNLSPSPYGGEKA